MADKSKKPAIRFAEFTDAWEQRKLGECFSERTESMLDGELLSVTINDGIKKFAELGRHDNSNDDKSKYKKVCVGDIAYNSMRMWQGASGYSAYEGIVSPAYTVLSPKFGVDSRCISYLIKRPDMIRVFQVNSQGITSDNWILKYPTLSEIEIMIAKDIAEQKQIAECFSNLDHLITLHQRKYDKLQNVKKSMLKKMFPKNGSNIPEIRFAGFTDAWEQRKLGEITSLITKGTTPIDKSKMGTVNFVKIESIDSSSGEITITTKISEDEHNGYLRRSQLQENDILFSIAGTLGRVTAVNKAILPANTNQALAIIRLKSECLSYITTYLKGKAVADFVKTNPTVGAQPNLSLEQVGSLGISLPSIEEQEKIGQYFHHLDALITLHQRELEKLKNLKKACLEKMFV